MASKKGQPLRLAAFLIIAAYYLYASFLEAGASYIGSFFLCYQLYFIR